MFADSILWVSSPTRKLLELSASAKIKGVASGKRPSMSIVQTLCKEMLLEAIPRNISASKISRYTVL